jgi:hypothetical protein
VTALSIVWALHHHGWADCVVSDGQAEVTLVASYVRAGPRTLIQAATRLLAGAPRAVAEFEAEPQEYRWHFIREEDQVAMRILLLPDSGLPDEAGTEIWASRQPLDTLARAVIRCFDDVLHRLGLEEYERQWGYPFPSEDLERLRAAWRASKEER